jgi:hypothetical protein
MNGWTITLSVDVAGDCEDLLRGLVALALAYVIRDRLDEVMPEMSSIPAYKRR